MRLLLFLAPLLLSSCATTNYLLESGAGQWRLSNRSRSLEDVANSPYSDDKTRHAIRLVMSAREFAKKDLGLKVKGNFTHFVTINGSCVLFAVSAADPLELKERKWKFPLLADLPSLGFFQKNSAEAAVARMESGELPRPDTWLRCVPAFSSLGWFPDFLYSSMLAGRDREIVDTLLHETLHATIWVPGREDFNEKLANFVAQEGSLLFINNSYGKFALQIARREVRGEQIFGEFLHLREIEYKAKVHDLLGKVEFYRTLRQEYGKFLEEKHRNGLDFVDYPASFERWNNAAFLSYLNYYSDYSIFTRMLQVCNGNLVCFVRWIALEQKKDPKNFQNAPEKFLAARMATSSDSAN